MKPLLVQSQLLTRVPGVVHAFTTRAGGTSKGEFSSLNLSVRAGDDKAKVEANRAVALGALGRSDETLVMLKQMHGDTVVEVTHRAGRGIEADGMWTRDREAVLAILVADCVPILAATEDGKAVAAVHAGWRGTRSKIAARMIERLTNAGYPAKRIVVALGPAIGPCCFTIGDDTALELRQAFPSTTAIRKDTGGRLVADLWQLNVEALTDAGVPAANIDVVRECTMCTADRYFSHRRDQGRTGRQAGLIALRSSPLTA